MPTGLTATLIGENERSFKDFALLCARHFGPLFFMRDDPLDKDIPDEVPTADADYYLRYSMRRETSPEPIILSGTSS